MEALILALVIAYAVKKAAESAHEHWQGSKASNRRSTRGQPVRRRAASAARHDAAYWAEQVRGGFPQVRHGLYMGWHSGRIAQLEGREARAQARAEHAQARARVAEAVREQRRRQDEALDRIRAAAAATPEPEPEPDPGAGGWHGRADPARPGPPPRQATDPPSAGSSTTPTEGSTMSGDTTYRQQLAELEAIRRDADSYADYARRQRMTSHLDALQGLGLDSASLAEAAAIDDALQAQEKAARQTLDAADAAIAGLTKRHGGIQEAVDDAPVDKPADPGFYQD